MSTISTNPPSGMRDFPPEELACRRYIEKIIRKVYESYGFVEIETPAIENLSTLLGKYGEEGDQLIFRILHRREKLARALDGKPSESDLADSALRYDLTVPFARFIANNPKLPRFFKRYQIQSVWRADRPGKGRFREFCQCDVDIIGSNSVIAEAEVCGAVARVLKEVGLTEFNIHLNHRQLLRRLICLAQIPEQFEESSLVALDKLDKVGIEGVTKELRERGIEEGSAKKLIELTNSNSNDNRSEIERLKSAFVGDQEALGAISQLSEMLDYCNGSPASGHLKLDCSLARGLGYYTGPIFEIRVMDLKGSLGGGGRYDNLVGMFKGSPIPAVGFSIGFERLVLVAQEKKLMPYLSVGPDVLLCRFPDVEISEVIKTAEFFRDKGLKVEIFPEPSKLGKQLSYAGEIKVKVAGILGSDELREHKITLKQLETGEQINIRVDEATEKILSWIKTGKK
ncbi:MAG: histidine--tRNA ligase [Candidatus Riflebacteria bacterium]|nr:histidine--tRNA ligase [Candidatus Riflebacteria bacterium]